MVFLVLEVIERVYRLQNLPYFVAAFGTFVLLFHYYECREFIRRSTKDTKLRLDMQASFIRLSLIPLLLSPLSYKAYYDLGRNSRNARLREAPPATAGKWARVNRDTLTRADLKNYLTDLQIQEEKLGSKSYEIWLGEETGDKHIAAFDGNHISRYEICPSCQGQTLKKPEIKVHQQAECKAATSLNVHTLKTCFPGDVHVRDDDLAEAVRSEGKTTARMSFY